MKSKKNSLSNSDLKKWGLFFLFMVLLALVIIILRPRGESKAREQMQVAKTLNREARVIAERTKAPQDLANLDISNEALTKAESLIIESDFSAALLEAEKSAHHARRILERSSNVDPAQSMIRFREISGEVLIKRRDKPDFEKANLTMPLELGDSLETSDMAGCVLGYSSRMETMLMPNSLVVLRELTQNDAPGGESLPGFYLEEGTLNIRASELMDTGKAGIMTDTGRILVSANAEAWVTYTPLTGTLEVRVRFGKVEISAGSNVLTIGKNQGVAIQPGGNLGPPIALPSPPELSAPANFAKFEANQNGFTQVNLEWTPVPDADHYQVELSGNRMFTQSLRTRDDIPGNQTRFPDLSPGMYFWRVTSIGGQGIEGIPSLPRQFQIGEISAQPSLPVDATPPFLRISRVTVQGYIVIIEGKSERDAQVTVQGESAILDDFTGNFTYTASLPGSGIYTINIVATDRAGNTAYKEKTVEIKD